MDFNDLNDLGNKLLIEKAFKKAFERHYFNVCALHNIDGYYDHHGYQAIRKFHCMHFKDMTEEQIDYLKAAVSTLIKEVSEPEPEKESLFNRFLRLINKEGK